MTEHQFVPVKKSPPGPSATNDYVNDKDSVKAPAVNETTAKAIWQRPPLNPCFFPIISELKRLILCLPVPGGDMVMIKSRSVMLWPSWNWTGPDKPQFTTKCRIWWFRGRQFSLYVGVMAASFGRLSLILAYERSSPFRFLLGEKRPADSSFRVSNAFFLLGLYSYARAIVSVEHIFIFYRESGPLLGCRFT